MVPGPRPEVVEMLEGLFVRHIERGDAGELFVSRHRWSTADERAAGLARARAVMAPMIAAYRSAADQQDAELRRGLPWSDAEWLGGIGVAE